MRKNIKFVYQDTSESIAALKVFVNLRESRPEFNQVKESGGVGFPCIVVNEGEKVIIGNNEEAWDKL